MPAVETRMREIIFGWNGVFVKFSVMWMHKFEVLQALILVHEAYRNEESVKLIRKIRKRVRLDSRNYRLGMHLKANPDLFPDKFDCEREFTIADNLHFRLMRYCLQIWV